MAKKEISTTAVLSQASVPPPSKSGGIPLGPRLTVAVADAISDEFSRMILSSSVLRGKTVDEISDERGIPQSTCYRRVRRLVDEGALVVERMVVAPTGGKYAVYRSAFARLELRLEDGVVSAYATFNPAVAGRLQNASD